MDLKLRGKRAFVSGSTAGIGFSVALGLASEGAEIVVNGRTDAKVRDAVRRIAGETIATVSGISADLSTAAGVEGLLGEFGPVDILVNNIGIFEPKPFLEIPDADWVRFFETNVMSGVRLSRALLPNMIDQGWGRIIFISSESGLNIPVGARRYSIPIRRNPELSTWTGASTAISKLHADVLITAVTGQIVPESILSLFPGRAVNFHPSLLPHYRGPMPPRRDDIGWEDQSLRRRDAALSCIWNRQRRYRWLSEESLQRRTRFHFLGSMPRACCWKSCSSRIAGLPEREIAPLPTASQGGKLQNTSSKRNDFVEKQHCLSGEVAM